MTTLDARGDGEGNAGPSIDWHVVLDKLREGLVVGEAFRQDDGTLNWRYLYVNPAWSRLTGLGPDGIIGRPVTEIIQDVDQDLVERTAAVAFTGQTERIVAPVPQLGRTFDLQAFPIDGNRLAILLVDVSERDRVENDLKKRTEELERIVRSEILARARTWDVTPDLLAIVDHDGYFKQLNPVWTKVLGHSRDELLRRPFMDFVHPDDIAATTEAYEQTKSDKPAPRFDNRFRCADGSYRWLSWVSVPAEDYIYCTARDITADKDRETELELRRVERNIYWSASPDLHVVMTLDGKVLEMSDAWATQLGYDLEDLKGTILGHLIARQDLAYANELFEELRAAGTLGHSELRLVAADGQLRWYGWTAAISGDLILATGRNIDDHRRRESKLRVAEEALRQAHKLETLGQLSGGIAHDFNNLLMAIQTNLARLRPQVSGANAQAVRLLEHAEAAADRGKTLVQHMLAFARRQELAPAAVDCVALVDQMDQLLRSSLGPGMVIRHDFGTNLPRAHVDANQLETAILNLAVNASDAMDGNGTLTISIRLIDGQPDDDLEDGQYVAVTVADNGPGMDEATLSQAMEPFFTTKGIGKGTGLGLSMVHGLAIQSGGAFRLTSRPGKGTRAEILLPVATATADATAATAILATPMPEAQPEPLRLKLLAVDDDILVLMGTVGMLEDLGHEVLQASSAAEALSIFEDTPGIDLLLTDQAMPKMTGVELAQKIHERHGDLPVVLCTGYSEMPKGAEQFVRVRLGKPFAERQLAQAIDEALRQDRPQGRT